MTSYVPEQYVISRSPTPNLLDAAEVKVLREPVVWVKATRPVAKAQLLLSKDRTVPAPSLHVIESARKNHLQCYVGTPGRCWLASRSKVRGFRDRSAALPDRWSDQHSQHRATSAAVPPVRASTHGPEPLVPVAQRDTVAPRPAVYEPKCRSIQLPRVSGIRSVSSRSLN